jgi:chaperonin GroEL
LVIAEDFGDEVLSTLVVNKMRGILKVAAVKAPDFGDRRTLILEDIAALTGGTVVSSTKGMKLDKFNKDWFGQARTATVGKDTTTVVDGKGDTEIIEARILELKSQIDKSSSPYEIEKLQERLSKMIGGVAIINVGGNSDIEIKEKRDRVEDSLLATKAALADGIVPGGGITLYKIALNHRVESNDNVSVARDIVRQAIQAPFKKILLNAGIENWWDNIPKDGGKVYDAKNHKIVDAFEAGIIDPAKVVITALINAASVAGTILTVESIIFEQKDKDEKSSDPMAGMM